MRDLLILLLALFLSSGQAFADEESSIRSACLAAPAEKSTDKEKEDVLCECVAKKVALRIKEVTEVTEDQRKGMYRYAENFYKNLKSYKKPITDSEDPHGVVDSIMDSTEECEGEWKSKQEAKKKSAQ